MSSIHFPPSESSESMKPVILPPGCARLGCKATSYRVGNIQKHDGYGVGLLLQRSRDMSRNANDGLQLPSNQLSGKPPDLFRDLHHPTDNPLAKDRGASSRFVSILRALRGSMGPAL